MYLAAIGLFSASVTAQDYPTCTSASSDPDGDGWGWENNQSCQVASSSSNPGSNSNSGGQQCDWHGSPFPLCVNQTSGWGYENNQSCIGSSTCNNEGGSVTGTDATGSSSGGSSSSSSGSTSPGNSATCAADPITPHLQVNGGDWQATGRVSIANGSTVVLGPHPHSGAGSWQWDGCGTSGSSREQIIRPNNSCEINTIYTNSCGAQSQHRFEITLSGDAPPPTSSPSPSPAPSNPPVASSGECGSGSPHAVVSGSNGNYTVNGSNAGSNYLDAINSAISSLTRGRSTQERVTVLADGSIGAGSINLPSHTALEVCGTMNVGNARNRGAIQATGVRDVAIPHLNMTGSPYFGLLFYDVHGLHLGQINLRLSSGLGIRFHRDQPGSTNVRMDNVFVSGTNNHGVETWNIDGLQIGTITARNTGYAGLLLNNSRNATIDLVDGQATGNGTGYATLRFANENGRVGGGYPTNIFVNRVISRGGGRGIFCVSNSGGVEINHIDLSNNGGNSILIENCHNVTIHGGSIDGGGEFRLAARNEFPNTSNITIANLDVTGTRVRESPCGNNVTWLDVNVRGGSYDVCN